MPVADNSIIIIIIIISSQTPHARVLLLVFSIPDRPEKTSTTLLDPGSRSRGWRLDDEEPGMEGRGPLLQVRRTLEAPCSSYVARPLGWLKRRHTFARGVCMCG